MGTYEFASLDAPPGTSLPRPVHLWDTDEDGPYAIFEAPSAPVVISAGTAAGEPEQGDSGGFISADTAAATSLAEEVVPADDESGEKTRNSFRLYTMIYTTSEDSSSSSFEGETDSPLKQEVEVSLRDFGSGDPVLYVVPDQLKADFARTPIIFIIANGAGRILGGFLSDLTTRKCAVPNSVYFVLAML